MGDYYVAKDMTGQKIDRLTVLARIGSKNGYALWECRCDCGNIVIVRGVHLRNKNTRSCGCLKKDTAIELKTKHGGSYGKTYSIWAGIIQRCTNPKSVAFHRYGGRGITVSPSWMKFENFIADMGESLRGLEIDRIDNNGNYEKNNCRWVTSKDNCNNTRRNKFLTYQEKTLTYAQWEEELGLSLNTITRRVALGWSVEKILSTKVVTRDLRFIEIEGEVKTVSEWARSIGIDRKTLLQRIEKWPMSRWKESPRQR